MPFLLTLLELFLSLIFDCIGDREEITLYESQWAIGHFQKYHNTLCLSSKLGLTIVSRENKNNTYAKVSWYF